MKYENFFKKKKIIFGFVLLFFNLILLLSIISYQSTDQSFFYYGENNQNNILGFIGTNIVAITLFLLGFSAFVFLFFLFYLSYLLIFDISIKHEWERLLAFISLIIISSAFCSYYNFSHKEIFSRGGLIGDFVSKNLKILLDKNIIFIFFMVSMLVSIILITRLSLLFYLGNKNFLKHDIHSDHICNVCSQFINRIYNFFITPFSKCNNWFHSYIYVNEKNEDFFSDAEYIQMLDQNNEINKLSIDVNNIQSSAEVIKNEINKKEDNEKDEKNIVSHSTYQLPNLDNFILKDDSKENKKITKESQDQALILEEKLKHFGISGSVTSIKYGPVITLFEYQPEINSKISKIVSLEDDLAMALQATSIRIIAPIPGKSVVGFEVSNKQRKNVYISKMIHSVEYKNFSGSLPVILGEDTVGNNVVIDLAKMPHLLVAGSTGSGKSVALNTLLISLLCKCTPQELKLILIDPKRLEFSPYLNISHLIFPIITLPKLAIAGLRWVVKEMENRYETMSKAGVKNINDYNQLYNDNKLPFIVIIIDELADLMITAGKDIEELIIRIAQMARASGIHLIVATQRPSVDVVTGLIKVNFPGRISFKVASKIDSRTILDCVGAEKLLSKGDMLFLDPQTSILKRVHGAYVSDSEITNVIEHIKIQKQPEYLDLSEINSKNKTDLLDSDDELYIDVIKFLNEIDEVSISLIQRKFRIGYNRSARIIETLESQGYILPSDGSKTRKVIKQQ